MIGAVFIIDSSGLHQPQAATFVVVTSFLPPYCAVLRVVLGCVCTHL